MQTYNMYDWLPVVESLIDSIECGNFLLEIKRYLNGVSFGPSQQS